ncbi:1,5-anhydro-D-fructose reductase [compost metagenome]
MRLGIVGAGMIVEDLLSFIGDIPSIQLEGISSKASHKEKMVLFKDRYGVKQTFFDYNQMLLSSEVDTIYVGLPNHLHYSYAKKALLSGKHVICEKPFTSNLKEFLEIKKIALDKKLILVEAITNQYLNNFLSIKRILPQLGEIKIVECNFSQYSSRYSAFKRGESPPVFNPEMSGGALMDINLYNIHLVVGLFGRPKHVIYLANIERNIDTSGILLLDYVDFKCVCIGSKDSTGPSLINIQGNDGYIRASSSSNVIDSFDFVTNKQESIRIDHKRHSHRMFDEFVEFNRMIEENDLEEAARMLEHSENVMKVIEQAKKSANLVFGSDQ